MGPRKSKKKSSAECQALFLSGLDDSGLVCLLVELTVFLTEFVNSTGCIHELRLACVERVALVADLHLNQRVFVSVFPLDGLFCLCRGLAQERVLVAHVFEHDQTVVVGMDAFFHLFQFLGGQRYETLHELHKTQQKIRKSRPLRVFHIFIGMNSVIECWQMRLKA